MGGGGTPSKNDVLMRAVDHRSYTSPTCSSTVHIAKKQYNSYPFPSVSHEGIISTKILPSDEQLLTGW